MTLEAVITAANEPEWAKKLNFGSGIEHKVENLTVGDCWLICDNGVTIVVERSTLSDLVGKIPDGGLFRQAAAIRGVTEWGYFIWTGMPRMKNGNLILGGKETKWRWDSMQGALLTVVDLGVSTLWVPSNTPEEYRQALLRLANRDRGDVRLKAKRGATMRSPGEAVLCSFAGISDKLAQQLLAHCGTAAYVMAAISQGDKLPNVGPTRCRNVRYALGLADDMQIDITIKQEEQSE